MNTIDRMLDHLRTNGWTQGKYERPSGACCILGAHIAVTGSQKLGSAVTNEIGKVFYEQFPERAMYTVAAGAEYACVPDLNDHPDTTFDDVEMVLEKASLRLDEAV